MESRSDLNIRNERMDVRKKVAISCEANDVLNYAAIHNGASVVRDITLVNLTDDDLRDLLLKVDSADDLFSDFEMGIELLKPGEVKHLKKLPIVINPTYLANLTEKKSCQMEISISDGENCLASAGKVVTALAFDEWPGLRYSPELLTSFSMPNHPAVTELLQTCALYLYNWTGDPSLTGYQSHDPNRVKLMAAAAYAAIQERNIVYAEPPSSFETLGQRIRLADAILEKRIATCMDLTLLYSALLEAMGLNPIMVVTEGHIFTGLWLMEESFSEMLMDDPSQLEKRMSKGIYEILVVECKAMCAGSKKSFDEAVALAEQALSDYSKFEFVIDVKRARSMGVHPLPVRIKNTEGYSIQMEERNTKDVTGAPAEMIYAFDFEKSYENEKVTKQAQWERKLLDISLRNLLINLRLTKAVVPILSADFSVLEDALADGEEFSILSRPLEMGPVAEGNAMVEALGNLDAYADYLALEGKHHKLHSLYSEKELYNCLTKMYRSAKTSLEENGASTLYLALGLLRWYESSKSTVARYAPIVLIPINIYRKSALKGYALRMRDEDAQLNITLLEFLKQNFDIRVPGLNEVPMDEHGLDLPKIFAIMRHAVMQHSMWDVVEAGFIGNFSFSQFVMWNDIRNKSAFLNNNKVVHGLISGAIDWDVTVPDSVDTDEAYLPITVDGSQLRAINMAAAGVSFVLHGPPGTGKSQTITAMIANALTKGKNVLFVAEKMAALEVVQKRLTALGIADFCLELHSNKATKKMVLDQLKRCLEIEEIGDDTAYEHKIQDIREMKASLDAYAKALHCRRPFGKSLRQLMDLYETIPERGHYVRFDADYALSLTESDLDHKLQSLERLIAGGRAIGHPHAHPLSAIYQTVYKQSIKFELEKLVSDYRSSLLKLGEEAEAFCRLAGVTMPKTKADWDYLFQAVSSFISVKSIPSFLRKTDDLERAFYPVLAYMEKYENFAKKSQTFLNGYNENFLRMDMESFRMRYDQANKKLFGKKKALETLRAEIQAYASFPVETDRIPVYLTDISFYQKEVREMEAEAEKLGYEWKKIIEQFDSVSALEAYEEEVSQTLKLNRKFAAMIRSDHDKEDVMEACLDKAPDYLLAYDQMEKKEAEISALLLIRYTEEDVNYLEERLNLCDAITDNASSLKDFIIYRQFEAECREGGLSPICDAYEEGLSHDLVRDVYLKSIHREIILAVIESEPVLNCFTGSGFNERIEQFKKLDQDFMDLTKQEMYCRLTRQLPRAADSVQISKELNILRRAISSNGRGVTIRSLFEQIPTILKKMCPCMLMSPISVAQYLAAENDLYDIVIFDEASQLPTCKAVGVLARGKNAVIVGDPNQMPPTSFFAGSTVDEDNLDIEDLDSILDDCLALGMPQSHLHWHYRSRHESLIAFSNSEFYENSMLTFPSVNDREKRVSLVKVDGWFPRGKGRINVEEAKAIVAEIKRRYLDPVLSKFTVGVVTFNITQQALIEDLLQEEYQYDPDFDKWANTGEEPLFIKNLENVQGDERDVILFSVAFGPDEAGRITLNFGPLNKDGGWKRLNVAVSRARCEMVVFSTMTPEMIDLKRTQAKGVESLKNFLIYAEKGRLAEEYVDQRVSEYQGILESICRQIEQSGFTYQKSIGHSRFKVDIAVQNPYNEDEYLLGIMLDGDSYHQSTNTKDREVAQFAVLKGLGWKLHRIWTLDWWDNKERELSRLDTLLKELKEAVTPGESDGFLVLDGEEAALACTMPEDQLLDDTSVVTEGEAGEATEEEMTAEDTEVDMDDETSLEEEILSLEMTEDMEEEETVSRMAEAETYHLEDFVAAEVSGDAMRPVAYALIDNIHLIRDALQSVIDTEAPVEYGRLSRKVYHAFGIARANAQVLEATERAIKKTTGKLDRQNGVRFYWREDQDKEKYLAYRVDASLKDKRSPEEISEQEMKNVLCLTILQNGPMDKEALFKEAAHTMGYSRSGNAIAGALERGLRYGRKTGEIILGSDMMFSISE